MSEIPPHIAASALAIAAEEEFLLETLTQFQEIAVAYCLEIGEVFAIMYSLARRPSDFSMLARLEEYYKEHRDGR